MFDNLARLKATRVRFAGWFPYPKVGVAELDPPTVGFTCSPMSWIGQQVDPVTLSCGSSANGVITKVRFASYGRASGSCGNNLTINPSCHANQSLSYVESRCIGRPFCELDPQDITPDPCFGQTKYFAVEADCANTKGIVTHWDFRSMDEVFLKFYESVRGDETMPIVSFSTQPTWLYSPTSWPYPQANNVPYYGYDKGPAAACNLTLLGDYYGRVLAWYTQGGFVDEADEFHFSGHFLNISHVEVFNEVDYEHEYDAVTYTKAFDAVVQGIRRMTKPSTHARFRFNGLSLPNIDDSEKVERWVSYFLNASNHAEDCRDALHSIGYHAYPTNGPYTPDPATFSQMFTYVDAFVQEVAAVDALIQTHSPSTETFLDECGTDMDQVLNLLLSPPLNNVDYWVASGSYFAYLFAQVSLIENTTVKVVGESQLMDSYPQEPSVTMMDWVTGNGTARYWTLKMLLDEFSLGDRFVGTWCSNSTSLFAQGFLSSTKLEMDDAGSSVKKVLLINKMYATTRVTINLSEASSPTWCSGFMIDESTLLGPSRPVTCDASGSLTLPPYATAVVSLK